MISSELKDTRKFWDASPCDGNSEYTQRRRFRYSKDPWIVDEIKSIIKNHNDILEIGCGQGTDAITFCELLPNSGSYLGFDLSPISIKSANEAKAEKKIALKVTPVFRTGDAEAIDIPSDTVGCAYSMGVLHHSADIRRTLAEIFRVLRPRGKAYIYIYNSASPKVMTAIFLRSIQKFIDRLFQTDKIVFKWVNRINIEKYFGTALLECFGVPYLNSYTKKEAEELVSQFDIESIGTIGNNIPAAWLGLKSVIGNKRKLGLFWRLELIKPE